MEEQLLGRAEYLHKESEALEEQANFIDHQIKELLTFKQDLAHLKDSKENGMLSSLGRGVFLKTEMMEKKLFVDVGANVLVRKNPEEVETIVGQQITKLGEMKTQLDSRLLEITEEFQSILQSIEKSDPGNSAKTI